jgi:arylsulfatase
MKQLPFFAVLFSLSFFAACNRQEVPKRPNLVIIIDDQHNTRYMGWTGDGEGIRTPNLNRLAAQSVAFTNAYASCPVCAPARHSMYTGTYPSRHGVILNDMRLRENVPTMMSLLADAGYTTANIGKMHFGPYNARHGFQYVLNHEFFNNAAGISHFRPWLEEQVRERGIEAYRFPEWNHADPPSAWLYEVENLGFEYDLPLDLTSEHWVTDQAIAFLEDQMEHRPDQPFLLHASYFAPHHPYGVVHGFNTYRPEDMSIPPSWSPEQAAEFGRKGREKLQYPPFTREDFQQLKAYYFGFISELDYEVGRLLEFIDSHPSLSGNTVILFLSDHGDRMGEHGMLYKGGDGAMYEGSVGIPFMIRWPGVVPRQEKTPVTHVDIMPTFLRAAGLEPDPSLAGMDLKPLLDKENTESTWTDRVVFSQWLDPLPFGYLMARKGPYKFIADNRKGSFPELEYELYNMEKDPWEMENLVDDQAYTQVVEELKAAVMDHFQSEKQFLPAEKPPIVPRSVWDIGLPYKPWEKVRPLEK